MQARPPADHSSMKRLVLLAIAAACLPACTSAYWYDVLQSTQYNKCEKLTSPEERRRCKADTYPDRDRYEKQREAASAASK